MLLIIACDEVNNEISGNYIFLETIAITSSREIAGACAPDDAALPSTEYVFDKVEKSLSYYLRDEFEVNNSLVAVYGWKNIFYPVIGVYNQEIYLTPVYEIPDSTSNILEITEEGDVLMLVDFKTTNHVIFIPVDSTVVFVERTIEYGIVEESLSDSCIWELVDSLAITNHGFQPRSKIKKYLLPE